MTKKYMNSMPIFCDRCSALALAEFDGMLLCSKCLFDEFGTTDLQNILEKITPLPSQEHLFAHSLAS